MKNTEHSYGFTELQARCLEVLAVSRNGQSDADTIAYRLGKPKNRLAVTSALRSLLSHSKRDNPDVSDWVIRIPPRDQWGCAIWCITDKARALLGYELKAGMWVRNGDAIATHQGSHLRLFNPT